VPQGAVVEVTHTDAEARITLDDGSTIAIPREWRGRITDLAFAGHMAEALLSSTVSMAAIDADRRIGRLPSAVICAELEGVRVNQVFYRHEPHTMRRYSALAFDNIQRAPMAFVAASVYRAVRVFVISGTGDRLTAQQFAASRLVYPAATVASTLYLILLMVGIVCAWRKGDRYVLPLLLIVYVPATIAPVLTNMRYSVTVQPIVFVFIARALTTLRPREKEDDPASDPAARGAAGTRTAHRP
jgi:hypothetical protein